MSTQARGLNNFISDLRNAKSKEEESNRIEVELAKIRQKFNPGDAKLASDGSNPKLSSYERKKYVWKLAYIHVLGYDVDFGHAEVVSLVRSKKFNEKTVGYVALSLLLRGSDSVMSSIIDTMKKDLITAPVSSSGGGGGMGKKLKSKGGGATYAKNDAVQCLALCSLANISGLELIQAMHVEVQQILISKSSTDQVKKKSMDRDHTGCRQRLKICFEKGFFCSKSIDSTLATYNNSCVEMRSEARDACIQVMTL